MSGNSTIGTFEECADELSEFVGTLHRYPPAVLALALRAHLSGLLHALRAQGEWSVGEIADFMEDMAGDLRES
jgi:hypothetical protein